ncbi:hypothetical protein PSPO01_13679 [Paraphaeosphaeria sporulosa]
MLPCSSDFYLGFKHLDFGRDHTEVTFFTNRGCDCGEIAGIVVLSPGTSSSSIGSGAVHSKIVHKSPKLRHSALRDLAARHVERNVGGWREGVAALALVVANFEGIARTPPVYLPVRQRDLFGLVQRERLPSCTTSESIKTREMSCKVRPQGTVFHCALLRQQLYAGAIASPSSEHMITASATSARTSQLWLVLILNSFMGLPLSVFQDIVHGFKSVETFSGAFGLVVDGCK